MDSPDINDTCKRPISLQKHLYLICQANVFREPRITFRDPNGAGTISVREGIVLGGGKNLP